MYDPPTTTSEDSLPSHLFYRLLPVHNDAKLHPHRAVHDNLKIFYYIWIDRNDAELLNRVRCVRNDVKPHSMLHPPTTMSGDYLRCSFDSPTKATTLNYSIGCVTSAMTLNYAFNLVTSAMTINYIIIIGTSATTLNYAEFLNFRLHLSTLPTLLFPTFPLCTHQPRPFRPHHQHYLLSSFFWDRYTNFFVLSL